MKVMDKEEARKLQDNWWRRFKRVLRKYLNEILK